MSVRKMVPVAVEDLRELTTLARAAIKLHQNVTHYGKCDICDLVIGWDLKLGDRDLDVNGINEWRESRKAGGR